MKNNQYTLLKNLHHQEKPLILYNSWNVITSKLLEENNSPAVGTSSYAIAESLGYSDGENMPFETLVWVLTKISEHVNIPITADIETGYAETSAGLIQNIKKLLDVGISGINLEDQLLGKAEYTLRDIKEQSARIKAIKEFAQECGSDIFVNARTDVFFKEKNPTKATVAQALERSYAYNEAGAECLFAPGLTDLTLIKELSEKSPLPVNIMISANSPTTEELINCGVKRISYGPLSYFTSKKMFEQEIKKAI